MERLSEVGGIRNWIRSDQFVNQLELDSIEKGTNVGSEAERTAHAVVQLLDISDERGDFSGRLEYDNWVSVESCSEFFKRATLKCLDSEKSFRLEVNFLSSTLK